jgi:hypothetical protein
MMACNCVTEINEMLAERNTRLSQAWVMAKFADGNPNLMVQTEQIETGRGKKKAATMFINFCPFCGTKYVGDE